MGALGSARLSWAGTGGDQRLVVVIFRGGMDGLSAVVPWADPDYRRARGSVAAPGPGEADGVLDLDGFFGLHPSLAPIQDLWGRGELGFVHASGLAYDERSHFDAQNVLENGGTSPFVLDSGWLNRAAGSLGAAQPPMAIGRAIPLILRGEAPVTSADPTREVRADEAFFAELADVYKADPALADALDHGLRTQAMLRRHRSAVATPQRGRRARPQTRDVAEIIGSVLAAADGPRIAVLEVGGWDTHTNQQGVLGRQLADVAEALLGFRSGLSEAWPKTAILGLTEFGRTVHGNGTAGTDHGTASVAWLAGGAVVGGTVHGNWPGLAERHLRDGRDLAMTTDLRAVCKGLLEAHLGVDRAVLEDVVFPGSRDVGSMTSLVRA